MPVLPTVDYSIACEDVRPEPDNKANILGFYGVLPRAAIRLQKLSDPVDSLVFLVAIHGGAESFTIQSKIFQPDNSTLVATVSIEGSPPPESASGGFAFSFPRLLFRQQGRHKFQVLLNDKEAYLQTFDVIEGFLPSP